MISFRVHIAILIAVFSLAAEAKAIEELIVYVPPDEVQAVIERNEIQYEELRWHSLPDRIRIAKINTALLEKKGHTFQISPFQDAPSIVVRGLGIDDAEWTGTRLEGAKSEQEIAEATKGDNIIADIIRGLYNTARLRVARVVRHEPTGEYFSAPPADRAANSKDEIFGDQRVLRPNADVITKVYGSITANMPAGRQGKIRAYTLAALRHDPDYVVIYEWDNAKDHHLLDPPHDREAFEKSALGQKFRALREDKARHMQAVTDRVAERNRQ